MPRSYKALSLKLPSNYIIQSSFTTMSADQNQAGQLADQQASQSSELVTPLLAENIGKRVTGPNREIVILDGLDVRSCCPD